MKRRYQASYGLGFTRQVLYSLRSHMHMPILCQLHLLHALELQQAFGFKCFPTLWPIFAVDQWLTWGALKVDPGLEQGLHCLWDCCLNCERAIGRYVPGQYKAWSSPAPPGNVDNYPCRLVTDMLGERLCNCTIFKSLMSLDGLCNENEAFDFWYTNEASEAFSTIGSRNNS